MSAEGRAARVAKMDALMAAVPDDGCTNGWWRMPRDRENLQERDWLDAMEPIVCGKTPAAPTDAPLALKYGTTRLCAGCAERLIIQEQLAVALENDEAQREISLAWLQANGHEVFTREDFLGDDDDT